MKAEEVPSNMKIHTRFIGRVMGSDKFRFEVNGVIIDALNIIEAQRKYLRKEKSHER